MAKSAIYLKLTSVGVAAPAAGTITLIVTGIIGGAVNSLYLDGTNTAARIQIENPSAATDTVTVVPVMIPVANGQKMFVTGSNATMTVEITPQA